MLSRRVTSHALRAAVALLACWAASAPAASADDVVVPIRADRIRISWTLAAPLHTVHGTFALTNGSLRFDTASNAVSGEVTVDLRTGGSGNAKRDANMQNEVLETATYPFAVFTARSMTGRLDENGTSHVALSGALLIHGARHDLTLPLDVDARDGRIESAQTRFSIPYVAWGMRDPSVFLLRVSDHVDVDVEMTARPAAGCAR